nr:hypothetical protein BaRGS_007742 [Batillaria attramentaria]
MAENMEQDVHEEDENSDDESMNKNSEDSDSEDNTEQDEARVRELEKEEERNKVEKLFELAVKDYLSVPVWLEYVQFVIGGMGSEGGIQHIRDVFENALTAVGLHVTQGANVWEAYREFENALLAGLMPQPGAVTTKEQEEAFNAQHQKIASLFKRQLAVPLMDMEESFAEYKEWLGGSVDPEVEKTYNKALAVMDKIKPFEEQLLASEAPHLEAYQKYIEFEIAEDFGLDGDPEASLRQYWASIEARYCKNLERARELWNAVMQEGYGNQAAMWLNYYRLERTFGDAKHCRRILQRALNSVTDWLECITQAYIDFEREEGTLEDYEQAYAKCADVMHTWRRLENRRRESDPPLGIMTLTLVCIGPY